MDKRRAVRIGVKAQVSGRMILVDSLEIEDLSMTGIRFTSMRRLEMNSPHRIKIVHGDVAIALKGTIVRFRQLNPQQENAQEIREEIKPPPKSISSRLGELASAKGSGTVDTVGTIPLILFFAWRRYSS